MWKKMFRKSNGLNYRKKHKCPECDDYTLYILHDRAAFCGNGCFINDLNINQIIIDNDYCGYYTSQELKKIFEIDDENYNQKFKGIMIDNTLHLFSNIEKQTIQSFFEKTSKLDDRLDDIMVDYFNINNIKDPQKLTPFGYVINLIEDIHFFINLCCKDLVLFNYGIEFASRKFYSGRFFYNNAVDHFFQADERIYVLLGIIYEYSFDSDLKKNKTFKLEKFLKKKDSYNSEYREIFEKLKNNEFYFDELKKIRNSNAHDLSYFSKAIDEDIRVNGNRNLMFWNRDGDKVDRDVYLPKIKNILFCLNEFYNLLDQVILHISNDKSVYQINTFPMLEKYLIFDDEITFNKYGPNDIKELEKEKIELYSKLSNYNSEIVYDIFFRIDEVIHCISDIYNIVGNHFYDFWRYIGIELDGLIDEQYLLYSSLLRIYSCYDKLSKYIVQSNLKYSNIRYFDMFQDITDNDMLINKLKSILNDDNYKILHKLRNDIYHNLRSGCLYGGQGLDYYNMVLFKTVFENIKIIYNLINFLNPNINIKVGRNELCPCGSGKKFKKCCGIS